MIVQDEIVAFIGKLDYSWFASIKRMFTTDKGYDPDSKRIIRTFHKTGHDVSTGEKYNRDINIDCSIVEYAWYYDFEDDRHEGDGLPVQGKYVALAIQNIINEYVRGSSDVIEQDRFITNALAVIISRLNNLKAINSDKGYSTVLSSFYNWFKAGISQEFGHIRHSARRKKDFKAFATSDIDVIIAETNYSIEEKVVREILRPMSGIWLKAEIMKKGDFDILVNNTLQFIENKGRPINAMSKPFSIIGMPEGFIRYTFCKLYRDPINGKINQGRWADFLKKSFDVFSTVGADTIRKKFATKPPKYDRDLQNTITYQ